MFPNTVITPIRSKKSNTLAMKSRMILCADAWRKDWIVLAQASEDMTFDVRHIRSIRYTNTMGADVRLREELGKALAALGYRAAMV